MDCNNFYASCERVFNPALNGKPIVVLGNNDGCVIARSNEAKALGIKMGVPAYQIKDDIQEIWYICLFIELYAIRRHVRTRDVHTGRTSAGNGSIQYRRSIS